jgi:hypothetical protein
MNTVRTMLTAKGALPMTVTIIRVQSISYIRPVIPDRKKHTSTKVAILSLEPYAVVLWIISRPYCPTPTKIDSASFQYIVIRLLCL